MNNDILSEAKIVLETEIAGLEAIRDGLGQEFVAAVELSENTLKSGGKLVLVGVGKSGHIGRKLAATLMSTGSPAAFMDPVEAMHGDLGMLTAGKDLVLALSYSGETDELLRAITPIKNLGCKVVAITGKPSSRLAALADEVLPMPVQAEACPFNLAPTTSTTALLALGDALAVVLMKRRGFTRQDYGRLHPSGSIGRTLTYTAKDIMHTYQEMPALTEEMTARRALWLAGRTGAPVTVVLDYEHRIRGLVKTSRLAEMLERREPLDVMLADIFEPCQGFTLDAPAAVIVQSWNEQQWEYAAVSGDDGIEGLLFAEDLKKFKL